jgi:hypothetical protein
VRFGSLRDAGEHNAQNLEIVAYIDYRLQPRHSHSGVVSSVSSKYPVRAHDHRNKECTLARNLFTQSPAPPFTCGERNVDIAKNKEGKDGRTGQHQWMATTRWSGNHVDGLTRGT